MKDRREGAEIFAFNGSFAARRPFAFGNNAFIVSPYERTRPKRCWSVFVVKVEVDALAGASLDLASLAFDVSGSLSVDENLDRFADAAANWRNGVQASRQKRELIRCGRFNCDRGTAFDRSFEIRERASFVLRFRFRIAGDFDTELFASCSDLRFYFGEVLGRIR